MSASAAQGDDQTRPSETVAGFLAAFAIFAGVISIGWHPLRLVLPAILIAMISAAMGGERRKRLTFAAVIITAACFFLGMTVSVVTSRPLW